MSRRVVIAGGGLAGMAAAEALARHGGDPFAVTLIEAKRSTGGRAGSFADRSSGQSVDYCQHVAMGCCTNLIGLLERCELAESLQRYRELCFLHPDFRPSRFAAVGWLPAPLHLAPALHGLRHLTRRQRRQIRRALWRLFRAQPDELREATALQWLRDSGQHEATIRDFWSVVVVSALGEQIDLVTMSMVRKVFVDGFAAARGASDVLVPRVPLAELFGRALPDHIKHLGVDVVTGRSVTGIAASGERATVETSDGGKYDADHVIVAVPWHAVGSLVPESLVSGLARVAEMPPSAITGLHLWFDREITDRPHAVLVGTVSQWLFRQPWQNGSTESGCYYQVVISGWNQQRSIDKDSLVGTVVDELRRVLPGARKATLLRSRVVTDPNSVFSIRPEFEAIRPPARTSLPWLHLAGDWIATGWPATMEGAVIGGRLAASSVAEQSGLESVEIDPGLDRGWLARTCIRPG